MSKEVEDRKKRLASLSETAAGISRNSISASLYKELSAHNQLDAIHETLASPAAITKGNTGAVNITTGLPVDGLDTGLTSHPNSSRINSSRETYPENENVEQLSKIISSVLRLKMDYLLSVIKNQEGTVLRHRDQIAKLEIILGRKDEDIASLESQLLNLKKNAGKDGSGFASQMELYTSIESNFSLRVNELLERNIGLHAENVKLKEHISTMKERVHLANQNVDRVERKAFFDRYAVLHCQNVLKDLRIAHRSLRSEYEDLNAGIQQFAVTMEESILSAIATAESTGAFKATAIAADTGACEVDSTRERRERALAAKRKQSTFNFRLRDVESISRGAAQESTIYDRKASVGFALGPGNRNSRKSVYVPPLALAGGSRQSRSSSKFVVPSLNINPAFRESWSRESDQMKSARNRTSITVSPRHVAVDMQRSRNTAASPPKRLSVQIREEPPNTLTIPAIKASPPTPMSARETVATDASSLSKAELRRASFANAVQKSSNECDDSSRSLSNVEAVSERSDKAPGETVNVPVKDDETTTIKQDTYQDSGRDNVPAGYTPLQDPALEQLRSHALQELRSRQLNQVSVGVQTDISGSVGVVSGYSTITAEAASGLAFQPSASLSRFLHSYQRAMLQPLSVSSTTPATTTATAAAAPSGEDILGDVRRVFEREDLTHLAGGFKSTHKYTIVPISPDDPARIFQRLSVNMREYVKLMNHTFAAMPFTTSTNLKHGMVSDDGMKETLGRSLLPFSPTRRSKPPLGGVVSVPTPSATMDVFLTELSSKGRQQLSSQAVQKKNSEFLRELIAHSSKQARPSSSAARPRSKGEDVTLDTTPAGSSSKSKTAWSSSVGSKAARATQPTHDFQPEVLEKILRGDVNCGSPEPTTSPVAAPVAGMILGGGGGGSYVLREWLVGFCWHVHGLLVSRLGIGLRGHGLGFGSVTTADEVPQRATGSQASPHLLKELLGKEATAATVSPHLATPSSSKAGSTAVTTASLLTRENHSMTDQEVMKIVNIIYNLMLWALNTMDLCKENSSSSLSKLDETSKSQMEPMQQVDATEVFVN